MSCFKYCILGMENAGKTEYIQKIGNLDIGSRGFKITVDKNEIPNSEKTDPTAYFENNYSLYSYDKQIFQFSWNDYSGNILKNREEYMQSYEKLQNDLVESDFLIIMINGDYFIQDSKEAITKELKRKYARFINPCISYSAEQRNRKTPSILFAITKCTQFLSKHSNAEISEIIQEAFNGIFSDEKSERIILMDNETEAAIKVPVLLSLENSLQECAANRKKALLENNAKLQDQVSDYQSFLKEQEERLILKNPFKIKEAKEEIFRLHTIIQKNNKLLSNDSIFSQERAFQLIVKKELSRNFNYLVYGFDDVQPEEVKSEVENNRNPVVSFVIGAVLLFLLYLLAEITIWEHPFWFSISTALVTFVYSRKQRFLVPFLILCLIIYVSISMWCYALVIISGVLQLGMMIGFYLKKNKIKGEKKNG